MYNKFYTKTEKQKNFLNNKDEIPKFHNSSSNARFIAEPEHKPDLGINIPSEIRCYGCLVPDPYCTVPCGFPQKCFLRAPTPYSPSKSS